MPVALDQTYSYRVPAGLDLAPGDVVTVPLGARGETIGVVWADNPTPNPRLHNRLKDVADKLDVPPLKPELRKFVDWVAGLHAGLARHGAAHGAAHGRASRARRASASACGSPGRRPQRMTAARARVLGLFADGLMRAQERGRAAKPASAPASSTG